jgi:hypothetical protein
MIVLPRPLCATFMRLLWNSDRWNIFFNHNKFNVPVIANRKVYVAAYDGRVDVSGLTP